jgi:hypothetical protein
MRWSEKPESCERSSPCPARRRASSSKLNRSVRTGRTTRARQRWGSAAEGLSGRGYPVRFTQCEGAGWLAGWLTTQGEEAGTVSCCVVRCVQEAATTCDDSRRHSLFRVTYSAAQAAIVEARWPTGETR